MKLNKRIKETFDKMVRLKIPRKKRRQYIQLSYFCGFKSWLYYETLHHDLDEISEKGISPEDAVKRIDFGFDALNRYSEKYYQHHHPEHFNEF